MLRKINNYIVTANASRVGLITVEQRIMRGYEPEWSVKKTQILDPQDLVAKIAETAGLVTYGKGEESLPKRFFATAVSLKNKPWRGKVMVKELKVPYHEAKVLFNREVEVIIYPTSGEISEAHPMYNRIKELQAALQAEDDAAYEDWQDYRQAMEDEASLIPGQ